MFEWLHKPDVAALILRLVLGSIFLVQGGMKILYGNGGTNWYLGENDTLAPAVQAAAAWGELICGFALVIGLLTRVAALGLMVIMLGAIYLVTWKLDFTGLPKRGATGLVEQPVGYEYNYAILAMCACLIILGAGLVSLDHLLWRKRKPRETVATPTEAPVAVAVKT
jgi:putative oxidoreductase